MAKIRIELNRETVRGILRGELAPEVSAKLLAMGAAVEGAATAAAPEGAVFSTNSHVGRNRFRVTVAAVNGVAYRAESEDRVLTLALNAARG